MADRELQTVLNSGEITSMYIGGVSSSKKVVINEDIALSMVAVGTQTPLAAQTLASGVAEKYTYFTGHTVNQGADIAYSVPDQRINIITSGTYKIMGTQIIEGGLGKEFDFCLRINGVEAPLCGFVEGRGAGKKNNAVNVGVLTLSAGDYLEIWITANDTSVTCAASSVAVEKIA